MKADVISEGIEVLQYKIDFFSVSDKLKSSNIRENLVSNVLYFLTTGSKTESYSRSSSKTLNQFLSDIETDESKKIKLNELRI